MTLLLLLAAAAAPQPAEVKVFGDWAVACDNGRACTAASLTPEGADWEGWTSLWIERGAAADAAPRIALGTSDAATRLLVDGAPVPAALHAAGGSMKVGASDAPAVLARLRQGRALRIESQVAGESGRVSLNGLAAALLYMDEQQQRLGTVTALVRGGPAPASAVPAPPPLPAVAVPAVSDRPPRPLSAAEAQRLRNAACESSEMEDEGDYGEATVARLDERHSLALVPSGCWSGAYNMGLLLLVAKDEGPWTPARLDHPAEAEDEDEWTVVYNAEFVREGRGLETYMKGRGIGDCGTSRSYAWDGGAFRLTRQSEMPECRGTMGFLPTWRAQTVERR